MSTDEISNDDCNSEINCAKRRAKNAQDEADYERAKRCKAEDESRAKDERIAELVSALREPRPDITTGIVLAYARLVISAFENHCRNEQREAEASADYWRATRKRIAKAARAYLADIEASIDR